MVLPSGLQAGERSWAAGELERLRGSPLAAGMAYVLILYSAVEAPLGGGRRWN